MTYTGSEEQRDQRRRYYLANRDALKTKARARHAELMDDPGYRQKKRENARRWREANREEMLRRKREKHAERMKSDPDYAARSRAANKRMNQKRIAKKMAPVREAAERGCALCGEVESVCLDFHHLDPATKSFDVSQSARQRKNEAEIRAEIQKCVVLCGNCHRKLHGGVLSLDGFDLVAYWAS